MPHLIKQFFVFSCLLFVFTASAFAANRVHHTGNVWLNLNDYGLFGTERGMEDPENPENSCPQCEFPGGSGAQYLSKGGLWIGALIWQEGYEEPRVSVALDGWVSRRKEFFPTPESGIIERSSVQGATDYLG